jgi:hypothetical protein
MTAHLDHLMEVWMVDFGAWSLVRLLHVGLNFGLMCKPWTGDKDMGLGIWI